MFSQHLWMLFLFTFSILGIEPTKHGKRQSAGSCPLEEADIHPWLIRLTTFPRKMPSTTPSTQPSDFEYDSRANGQTARPTMQSLGGWSVRHGSLITPSKVLTSAGHYSVWAGLTPFPEGYLSLIGYNYGKNCKQQQWAKDVIFQVSEDSQYKVTTGEFALIFTYHPFVVRGNPFLFGSPVDSPDFGLIAYARRKLSDKPSQVVLYLFKDNTDLNSPTIYSTTNFVFIPWVKCRELSVMKSAQRDILPMIQDGLFFCVNGSSEWPRPLVHGVDWFQGAPVLYKPDSLTRWLPIGQYYMRVDLGDLRIFSTFTRRLEVILNEEVNTMKAVRIDEGAERSGMHRDVAGLLLIWGISASIALTNS